MERHKIEQVLQVAQIVSFFQKSVASIKRLLDESNKEIYIHNRERAYITAKGKIKKAGNK